MPKVINTVTKASPTDDYPVVKDTDLSGSYRIVATTIERDAIVPSQRKQSMLVFVIANLHYYSLQVDLLTWTDLGTSLGGGGSSLPIVQQVYLVQDPTDAARMGGVASNVYTTFQTAYDAANILAGSTSVVIMVGKTDQNTIGDLILTADWNTNIYIAGISPSDSGLGNIIADNALGNAFNNYQFNISNVSISNISAKATGPTGDGGEWAIQMETCWIADIDTSVTDITNLTGIAGYVSVGGGNSICGNIIMNCNNSTSGGGIAIAGTISTSVITSTSGIANISLQDCSVYQLNIISSASMPSIRMTNVICPTIFITISAAGGTNAIYINACKFGDFSINNTSTALIPIFQVKDCNFTVANNIDPVFNLNDTASATKFSLRAYNCTFSTIQNLAAGSRLYGCDLQERISSIGTNCVLADCTIGSGLTNTACISNATAVSVTFNNSYYRVAPQVTVTFITANSVIPSVRYVYLVQDASDLLKMGDRHNNVYTTLQAAYDAAVVIQTALGGTNKVVIQVGNTTAAAVGNLTMAVAWNTNISLVGISQTSIVSGTSLSEVGTISILPTTGGPWQAKFSNVKIGNMTLNVAGILQLSNCIVGNITVIRTGTTGILQMNGNNNIIGAITDASTINSTVTLSINLSNSTLGAITLSTATLNVGNILISSINLSVGAIVMNNTAATGVFTIGSLTIQSSSSNIVIASYNSTLNSSTAGGTIGGINIDQTCQSITISGAVLIVGNNSAVTTPLQTVITQLTMFNTRVGGGFYINAVASAGTGKRGGYIGNVNIQRCVFESAVRIFYNPSTAVIVNQNFLMQDCILPPTAAGLYVQNKDISFTSFAINNCSTTDSTYGVTVTVDLIGGSTVPFMVAGNSVQLKNIKGGMLSASLYNATGIANTVDDVIVSLCNVSKLFIGIYEGDINFNISNTNANTYELATFGPTPITKQTVISSSNLSAVAGTNVQASFTQIIPLLLNSSHLMFSSDAVTPSTINVTAYSSFVDSVASAGATNTYTGTLYTSTIKRRTTEIVGGLVLNTSYDQSY